MSTLAQQTILITGAGRGIGRAAALELASAGATVIATVRTAAAVAELSAALGAVSGSSSVLACDVSDNTQVSAMLATVLQRYGALDALVNNAGVIAPIAPIETVEVGAWLQNLMVNLAACMFTCRTVLPHMLERGRGVIINLSSGAATTPLEGWSAYCAAKAGLAMFTRSLALETGGRGLLVYGLRPGVVDTDMQAQIRASGINRVSQLRRADLADPREPARAIAYLCTPAAADLAGQEVDIRDAAFRSRVGLDVL